MRGQISVEARLRGSITRLKKTNKKQQAEIVLLKKENAELKERVETLEVQFKQLQTLIFSRKHSGEKNDDNKTPKPPRDNSSYRRPIPKPEEITKIESYSINDCPECNTSLILKTEIVRYIVDILLPTISPETGLVETPSKTVTKQKIQKGYCPKCQCWHIAKLPVHSPPAKDNEVVLGPGIREFISFQSNIIRNTYTQIKDELTGLYNIEISQGEIANILEKTSHKLAPEYECLKERVKQSRGCHLDETGWQTKKEKMRISATSER